MAEQSAGGSVRRARKLVEEARRANSGKDSVRRSQEAAYRFMSALAGDVPGFEEAARALFAGDGKRFDHASMAGRLTFAITQERLQVSRSGVSPRGESPKR
jgi:hypothetical protein